MSAPASPTSPTLKAALEHAYETRWCHARGDGKAIMGQAKLACFTVAHALDPRWPEEARLEQTTVAEVSPKAVQEATRVWYHQGLSPATITKRLNCLSVLGVNVGGCRPPKDRKLKWWLTPEEAKKAKLKLTTEWAVQPSGIALWNHIQWTILTGLRVEETLALTYESFSSDLRAVNVPGLKTPTAQATLPLSEEAWEAGMDLINTRWTDYKPLAAEWASLRTAMGWPPEATLKALRRNAARYLHVDRGMPLDMVRQYLRHEDIETTMEYLRLAGGYRLDEMRRYLGGNQ